MQHFDARILIGIAILLFGGSSFFTSHLDSNFAGPQFYVPLVIRALGQPLIMVPLSAVSTAGMAKGRESGSASALFNMIRNIGGLIGIAGTFDIAFRKRTLPLSSHRRVCDHLLSCCAGTPAAVGNLLHVSRQRSVFCSHARGRRRGPPPGIPARIQPLFPCAGLCIALKRNRFVLYEKARILGVGGAH
jgi:hypothetical protein